jgi:hypothetical protein
LSFIEGIFFNDRRLQFLVVAIIAVLVSSKNRPTGYINRLQAFLLCERFYFYLFLGYKPKIKVFDIPASCTGKLPDLPCVTSVG